MLGKVEKLTELLESEFKRDDHPKFKAGDSINVHYKIKEGNKERIQQYAGVVIQIKGRKGAQTITVRKISGGIGVERIIPLNSPFIEKIVVTKVGVVRRARIFYLRKLQGKAARIRGVNE